MLLRLLLFQLRGFASCLLLPLLLEHLLAGAARGNRVRRQAHSSVLWLSRSFVEEAFIINGFERPSQSVSRHHASIQPIQGTYQCPAKTAAAPYSDPTNKYMLYGLPRHAVCPLRWAAYLLTCSTAKLAPRTPVTCIRSLCILALGFFFFPFWLLLLHPVL